MGVKFQSSTYLSAALVAGVFHGGCYEKERTAFDSVDLAKETLPSKISCKVPIVLKMDDGNLMCITESPNHVPHFYKTSSGYGEKGVEVSLRVVNAGVDYSVSDVYMEINILEALAYFKYDWRRIQKIVANNFTSLTESIDPELTAQELELWADGFPEVEGEGKQKFSGYSLGRLIESGHAKWVKRTTPDSLGLTFGGDYVITYPKSHPNSVYYLMPSGDMLKVTEDDNGMISFYKNASGYAVGGVKGGVVGVGGGVEVPMANLYSMISAKEVHAHFDGDVSGIMARAKKQAKIMFSSVDPDRLELALAKK